MRIYSIVRIAYLFANFGRCITRKHVEIAQHFSVVLYYPDVILEHSTIIILPIITPMIIIRSNNY